MASINSVFEVALDISRMTAGGVAMVTLHRNSYKSIEAPLQNKLAMSLIYNKGESDEYIKEQSLNPEKDIMVKMEIFGVSGAI